MNAGTNGHSESITPELLSLIRALAAKAQTAKASYDTVLQEISLQYQLTDGDNVDLVTGKITRKPAEQ